MPVEPREVWRNLQQTVSESALAIDVEANGFNIPEPMARRAGCARP